MSYIKCECLEYCEYQGHDRSIAQTLCYNYGKCVFGKYVSSKQERFEKLLVKRDDLQDKINRNKYENKFQYKMLVAKLYYLRAKINILDEYLSEKAKREKEKSTLTE